MICSVVDSYYICSINNKLIIGQNTSVYGNAVVNKNLLPSNLTLKSKYNDTEITIDNKPVTNAIIKPINTTLAIVLLLSFSISILLNETFA